MKLRQKDTYLYSLPGEQGCLTFQITFTVDILDCSAVSRVQHKCIVNSILCQNETRMCTVERKPWGE